MPRVRDITGQRFGRLVAVRRTGEMRQRSSVWECRCDCGEQPGVKGLLDNREGLTGSLAPTPLFPLCIKVVFDEIVPYLPFLNLHFSINQSVIIVARLKAFIVEALVSVPLVFKVHQQIGGGGLSFSSSHNFTFL